MYLFQTLDRLSPDAILGLMAQFRADPFPVLHLEPEPRIGEREGGTSSTTPLEHRRATEQESGELGSEPEAD